MKKHLSTIILILIILVGLSVMLYPSISNYWNTVHQSRVVATYKEDVKNLNEEQRQDMIKVAKKYNKELAKNKNRYNFTNAQLSEYNSLLNVSGKGIMGYIEIESIDVYLPIYHGTSDEILQTSIGHIQGTSLPVGGKTTHSVLSGHRGLPSALLFTDLDKMVEGDIFTINVLDKVYTYKVDKISIVLPEEMEELEIVQGKDYCTLMTCTPYGVNSHRLLVRGYRISNAEASKVIIADANQIDPMIIAPIVATPMIIILLVYIFTRPKKKKK